MLYVSFSHTRKRFEQIRHNIAFGLEYSNEVTFADRMSKTN